MGLMTADVGRLWVPELTRVQFLPGRATPRSGHMALVTYSVRDGRTGRKTQAGYGIGVVTVEGLRNRWRDNAAYQRRYPTPEAMLAAMQARLRNPTMPSFVGHNERVNNGSSMVINKFWGVTTGGGATSDATVNSPTRIALCNLNTFGAAAADQSLGSNTANVTTNEFTTDGLARTAALTPSGVTAGTTLDGQFSLTIANTFTDATASNSVYGAGLVDNTTTAFNMYAEASFTVATLQINDTLTVTWTVQD